MPTIEHCLTNFQPFKKFKVPSSRSHSYGDPIYRKLGEKALVSDWDDFTTENLKKLRNLAPHLNKEIEMTFPETFSSDLMLFSEPNLDSFVANTLLYTVKTVLGHIFEDSPISIFSQVPFIARSLKNDDPGPVLQRYTPDYSVFRGDLEEGLVDSVKAALVVGDAKLIGTCNIPDKELLQKGKSTAQRHHMGQLLCPGFNTYSGRVGSNQDDYPPPVVPIKIPYELWQRQQLYGVATSVIATQSVGSNVTIICGLFSHHNGPDEVSPD
ncbi:hypothetical protein BELL_0454g00060 [Botrytis elliptica]|uniref:Uncharacterized protein n=1 Tax=Botrytis elliptica TaxID=278938 RepID=A0A4Z1JG37_9HELO|nr:hypothetical protein BELL_0454g00060 [Botrytis elliptica]